MWTPADARRAVLDRIPEPQAEAVESIPLAEAAGRFLARGAVSDVDLPPFEKSMMDGFAVRSTDFGAGSGRSLRCVGESRAGVPFEGAVEPGTCIEIYTGAKLPADCDAVEMVERTERDGDEVRFEGPVAEANHVSHLGDILAHGRTMLEPPHRLTPADLSLLASIGCDPVPVFRAPRVSVLTTGDELVPPSQVPGEGQIREGNTLQLAAACRRLGCDVRRMGIVRDDEEELRAAFLAALEEGDALITTGGVSVGKYDLVGRVFESIGVEPVLHKVAIKPGKPIWFGMRGRTPVFGLPGNPVSSLLGFEVFVRPSLLRLSGGGLEAEEARVLRGRWTGPPRRAGDRQFNLPARRAGTDPDGVLRLEPVPFRGSSDVVSTSLADAFVVVPVEGAIETGALVDFRPLT